MPDDVQVKFGAQIGDLIDGIAESKEALEGLSGYVSGIGQSFTELAEAVGVAFAVDKIADFEDKFAELGEQIDRTSRITGTSTAGVQEFSLATKLAGGDAATAAQTLNILQKNIGDAISKAGPAREAFEGMGLSLEQLKNTDIVTLLFQMKQRLDEAGNSAEQSALKQEYLRTVAGRGAAQFLALGLSLEEVKKIGEETGYVMSSQMVGNAKELSDQTHTLSAAWTALSNNVANKVSPAYEGLIGTMTNVIEKTNELITANDNLKASDQPYDPGGLLKNYQDVVPSAPQGRDLGEGQFGPNLPPKPLAPLTGASGGGGDDDKTAEQIERSDYQTALEVDKLKLQSRKDADQAMVESGQLSAAQQIADLKQMAAQEYALEIQAVDQLAGTYDDDSAEYAGLQNKKLVLAQEYQNEIAKLNEQAAAEQKKQYDAELAPWKQLMSDMGAAADTSINGILSGTQTWKQALSKSYDDLGIKFSEVMAKMTAEYAVFTATSGKGILGFGTTNPFAALSGGGQQTAQIANTAALTTLNAQLSTLIASMGLSVTATTANTTATATAGAQGLLATAENTVATVANTISTDALRVVELIKTFLPSFDVGSYSVPSDMIAQIHQGEMIIPASQAQQIRAGSASLGGHAGSSTGAGAAFTININAIDTQTGAQFLKSNASVIASTLSGQMRNFNARLQN